jgi:hypothetical protein
MSRFNSVLFFINTNSLSLLTTSPSALPAALLLEKQYKVLMLTKNNISLDLAPVFAFSSTEASRTG